MNPSSDKAAKSDKFIIATLYFLYFGALGIYLPYFNLYCYHIGFGGMEIGVLSAIRSVAVIFFPLVWSTLADRYQARGKIFILCSFISTGVWAFYLLTQNFFWMAVITLFYALFYAPIISFLEAFTMDALGSEKKGYGRIRAWGSISFILMVTLVGRAIDYYPINIVLILILAISAGQSLVALKIPAPRKSLKPPKFNGLKNFFNLKVTGFLLCAFLMLVSHGAYYGFFSIHLERLGYEKTFIGFSWALGVVAEILVMIRSRQLFISFSLEKVLIFSFAIAVLRWLCLYFFQNPAIILITQLSHALTYGTFHMASILYIDRMSPEGSKTFGQAINNAVTYGLGLTVGFLINGYAYERLGSFFLFLLSSLIAFLAGVLFIIFMKVLSQKGPSP